MIRGYRSAAVTKNISKWCEMAKTLSERFGISNQIGPCGNYVLRIRTAYFVARAEAIKLASRTRNESRRRLVLLDRAHYLRITKMLVIRYSRLTGGRMFASGDAGGVLVLTDRRDAGCPDSQLIKSDQPISARNRTASGNCRSPSGGALPRMADG
jgi:hypothetical protein